MEHYLGVGIFHRWHYGHKGALLRANTLIDLRLCKTIHLCSRKNSDSEVLLTPFDPALYDFIHFSNGFWSRFNLKPFPMFSSTAT